MTLSTDKCHFLYKKKVGRTLLYEVSPYRGSFFTNIALCFTHKAYRVRSTYRTPKAYIENPVRDLYRCIVPKTQCKNTIEKPNGLLYNKLIKYF